VQVEGRCVKSGEEGGSRVNSGVENIGTCVVVVSIMIAMTRVVMLRVMTRMEVGMISIHVGTVCACWIRRCSVSDKSGIVSGIESTVQSLPVTCGSTSTGPTSAFYVKPDVGITTGGTVIGNVPDISTICASHPTNPSTEIPNVREGRERH
jgi:hypothetical protein